MRLLFWVFTETTKREILGEKGATERERESEAEREASA